MSQQPRSHSTSHKSNVRPIVLIRFFSPPVMMLCPSRISVSDAVLIYALLLFLFILVVEHAYAIQASKTHLNPPVCALIDTAGQFD